MGQLYELARTWLCEVKTIVPKCSEVSFLPLLWQASSNVVGASELCGKDWFKKSGAVHHIVFLSCEAGRDLVARSAGFR